MRANKWMYMTTIKNYYNVECLKLKVFMEITSNK